MTSFDELRTNGIAAGCRSYRIDGGDSVRHNTLAMI